MNAQAWTAFGRDCQAFVRSEWAVTAAKIGWNVEQLFGCHRERPWILNWRSAMWFLGGGKILALTETLISIENTRGTRQSIRRPDHPFDIIVPIWDLLWI
jgi:hypothetical protein